MKNSWLFNISNGQIMLFDGNYFFSCWFLNSPFNILGNYFNKISHRYAKIKLGLIIIFYHWKNCALYSKRSSLSLHYTLITQNLKKQLNSTTHISVLSVNPSDYSIFILISTTKEKKQLFR